MNENTIHTGRNAHKMGLLQSSILPYVCAGGAGMIESVKNYFHKLARALVLSMQQTAAQK